MWKADFSKAYDSIDSRLLWIPCGMDYMGKTLHHLSCILNVGEWATQRRMD